MKGSTTIAVETVAAFLKVHGGLPVNVKLLEGSAESEVLFDLSRHEAVGRHSTAREKVRITVSLPVGRKFERTLTEDTVGQVIRLSEE